MAHYVEELNGILLQERELLDKYKIKTKQIERVIERFLRNINGNIDKMLCKRFLWIILNVEIYSK